MTEIKGLVNISRKTKEEAEQAVEELQKRGYKVKFPVTRQAVNSFDFAYVARMEKDEEK